MNFCDYGRHRGVGTLAGGSYCGFVADSQALANHMSLDPSATAVLDVHDPEPIEATYPLLGLPNVSLYPHAACKTQTATINMGWVVKDVNAVLQGDTPRFEALLS